MAPVNKCLTRTFIVVDVIIGILGIIWLVLILFLHGHSHSTMNYESWQIGTLSATYAFGVWVVLMCTLGLYGILKKKLWALIVFSVGMILVSLIFLVAAVPTAIGATMTEKFAKVALKPEKPLNEESEDVQSKFETIQYMFQCCGFLNGTHDWGDVIPPSCRCLDWTETSAQCISINVTSPEQNTTGEVHVYEQPCFPYLFQLLTKMYRITATFQFAVLLFLVVGPMLSIVILCQMRRKTITPPVTFTTHASDSRYTELK